VRTIHFLSATNKQRYLGYKRIILKKQCRTALTCSTRGKEMYSVLDTQYKSFAAIKRECKSRLASYGNGYVGPLNKEDAKWFVDLIKNMHPNASEKLCKPVAGVEFYSRYGVSNNNLRLVYDDGSKGDFSWNACCRSKQSSDLSSIKNALRTAINDQVAAVLSKAFLDRDLIVCPMTFKVLGRDAVHVDHAPPAFADIVAMWLRRERIDLCDVPIEKDTHGGALIKPGRLLESWWKFHRQHANLRVVSAKWNMQAGKHKWTH